MKKSTARLEQIADELRLKNAELSNEVREAGKQTQEKALEIGTVALAHSLGCFLKFASKELKVSFRYLITEH